MFRTRESQVMVHGATRDQGWKTYFRKVFRFLGFLRILVF